MVQSETELIGLLPGSKPAKLAQGVPLGVAIAEYIHQVRPQTRFVIPVAPTLDFASLARFANPQHNPLIQQLGYPEAELIIPENNTVQDTSNLPSQIPILDSITRPILKTSSGVSIELYQGFPAYDLLSCCQLCLTTVGANTAELGSLAIPMIVLLPTQQLDAMRSWDGLGGILARLPGIGSTFAKVINGFILRQGRLFAWPNIWAKKEIVPELLGKLQPQDIAQLVIGYLEHPEKLEEMRSHLRQVRGKPGAAQKLAEIVREELNLSSGVEAE
jgi:lipid-A-disaccharide synthase